MTEGIDAAKRAVQGELERQAAEHGVPVAGVRWCEERLLRRDEHEGLWPELAREDTVQAVRLEMQAAGKPRDLWFPRSSLEERDWSRLSTIVRREIERLASEAVD